MMQNILDDLNPSQLQAATEKGNCMVLAGPGSGKTKTMASKAANLLMQGRKVVAVTFTKDSAMEIRHRIIKTAGNQYNDNLIVGTFHGLCYLLLSPNKASKFGKNILEGLKGSGNLKLNIASEGDKQSYIQRALYMANLKDTLIDVDAAASMIEQAKSLSALDQPMSDEHHKLFIAYQEVLLRNYKIDFQDLITETVKGFRSKKTLPFATDYLLVDESQDIDAIQYEWISQHVNNGVVTTIVGDDDQSIFAFRSALGYQGMEKFAKEFRAARVVLNVNYRCKKEILDSASILVRKNLGRLEKDLIANKGAGGSIEYRSYSARKYKESDTLETKYECDEIAKELSKVVGIESSAVIGRTNSVLDDVEEAMIRYNMPYVRQGGGSILDRKEAAMFVTIIESVCGRNIKSGIDNILSWAGMSENTLRLIHQEIGENIIGVNAKALANIEISDTEKKIFTTFGTRVNDWKLVLQRSPVLVIEGIKRWMFDQSSSDYEIRIIDSFANIISAFEGDLLKRIDDLKNAKSKKEATNLEVVLITAHSSKGLEWDNVWISSVDKDSFPDDKSSLEEERRLMYVAMTRARNRLIVSSSKVPSQFIDEAGLYQYQIKEQN